MTTAAKSEGAHLVLAQVAHGEPAEPIVDGPFCSPCCASLAVDRLAGGIVKRVGGSATVHRSGEQPFAAARTPDGRIWIVRVVPPAEVALWRS
ncbi:hypothetical protein ACH41E_30275 [Streptomyces sp. NPDC020412]|uniref:hypothetical protein n=1 Tax=Streptomyces sp. NPDC020412 TaxID=3365073 RepID=UPI0037AB1FA4